jgi:hypothetical protein
MMAPNSWGSLQTAYSGLFGQTGFGAGFSGCQNGCIVAAGAVLFLFFVLPRTIII